MAQRIPNVQAQRDAMQKLAFLTGQWVGEARLLRGPTEFVELLQTASGGQALLQAFGIISYDDESETYHLRAFNDGRFLETEVKLLEHGKGMTWGFALGEIKTKSVLRINEHGEWTEFAEIFIGSQSPKKLLELTVRPQQ